MTDKQTRIGAEPEPLTWDGQPLYSPETAKENLFDPEAFEQMPGQLSIDQHASLMGEAWDGAGGFWEKPGAEPMKRSPCRQRKVRCPNCGNTARQTRSWMQQGFLGCPCGGRLEPSEPCDRAVCGLLTAQDVSQAEWNTICRELDWPIVRNHGQQVQADRAGIQAETILRVVKPQCSYPGCGKWTGAGHEYCPQHSLAEVAAIPF